MAFMHFYLDEAGHSSSDRIIALAGFMAEADSWDGFADKWNDILEKHHVRPPFHMTDFEAKQGQFEGWDEERQRRPLLSDLLLEITDPDRRLFLSGAAISVPYFTSIDWAKSFPGHEPIGDAYHLALQDALQAAVQASEDLKMGRIAVVISRQEEFGAREGGRAEQHFNATSALASNGQLVAVAFGRPVDYPALQAADIAAFELRWRLTCPQITRYPWKTLLAMKRTGIRLRGLDPSLIGLAGQPFQSVDVRDELIMQMKGSKAKTNQGKRSRRR